MPIRVELFAIPRARAGVSSTTAEGTCLGDVLVDLATRYPDLAETCFCGRDLRPEYIVNLRGEQFVRDPETPLTDGDTLLLLTLDVGG